MSATIDPTLSLDQNDQPKQVCPACRGTGNVPKFRSRFTKPCATCQGTGAIDSPKESQS